MVEVKLHPGIARRGGGFCDIDGRQDILPPRDKSGFPVVDHVFTLEMTPFVSQKISTGELIPVGLEKGGLKKLPVYVNGEMVSEVAISEGMADEDISQALLMDEKVTGACGDREIKKFSVGKDGVDIRVK
ncbi:MAG TPA: hypothetical protein PK573_07740 [Spirochaetota bacterium]|nr:hypothetical protein [Spirochaetota bacterium]HRZ28889.1 hypothetical protein [Spirochaetota bacterium]